MIRILITSVFVLNSYFLYSQDNEIKGFNGCDTCWVLIPNTFSPNGDGRNDLIYPKINCQYSRAEILVYDSNGEIIFSTNNIEMGWDGLNFAGEKMPTGEFTWSIKIWSLDSIVYTFDGDIFLLRV